MADRAKEGAVIVTGVIHGIGCAVAMELAEEGADVLVNTRGPEMLDAVYEDIKRVAKGGKVAKLLADVSYEGQVEATSNHAMVELGEMNIVVNNAAVSNLRPALQYTSDFWEESLWVNLYSIYYTCTRATREMVRVGEKGSLINFSSIRATWPYRQLPVCDNSKGATGSLARALTLGLAPFDITVNAIALTSILGFCMASMDPEKVAIRGPKDFVTPITRQGTPEDVAEPALFLASKGSSYTMEQIIPTDGRLSVQAKSAYITSLEITPMDVRKKDIR